MPPTAATLPDTIDAHHEKLRRYGDAFLAGFRNANTRTSYRQQLHRWFAWCDAYGIDPLAADRVHLELHCRWFEQQVGSINTVSHGLSVLASFYRWLAHAEVLATTPMAAVRRPRRDDSSKQTKLTRHQLADWLNAAEQQGGAAYATACLLALNGLRVSEVCAIDLEDIAEERWHQVVSPSTARATDQPPSLWHRAHEPRSSRPSRAANEAPYSSTDGTIG